MTEPLKNRLEQFRRQRRIQATSLITTVFGDAVLPRGGSIWLGSLIALLEPLNLNDRLIRTSVFRLVKDAWLNSETVGRRSNYSLTPSGRRRFEEASRQIYSSRAPIWDCRWRMIFQVKDIDAKQREQLRRTLFWRGYGVLNGTCFIHPSADLSEVLDEMASENFGNILNSLLPMVAADFQSTLAASESDLVQRAWDLSSLAKNYTNFVLTYQPILNSIRFSPLQHDDEENAFLLRILLIHDYRRLLLRDPELPDAVLPSDWPGSRARVLCKELYKRLEPISNRHLDRLFKLADESVPAWDESLSKRFSDFDSF